MKKFNEVTKARDNLMISKHSKPSLPQNCHSAFRFSLYFVVFPTGVMKQAYLLIVGILGLFVSLLSSMIDALSSHNLIIIRYLAITSKSPMCDFACCAKMINIASVTVSSNTLSSILTNSLLFLKKIMLFPCKVLTLNALEHV